MELPLPKSSSRRPSRGPRPIWPAVDGTLRIEVSKDERDVLFVRGRLRGMLGLACGRCLGPPEPPLDVPVHMTFTAERARGGARRIGRSARRRRLRSPRRRDARSRADRARAAHPDGPHLAALQRALRRAVSRLRRQSQRRERAAVRPHRRTDKLGDPRFGALKDLEVEAVGRCTKGRDHGGSEEKKVQSDARSPSSAVDALGASRPTSRPARVARSRSSRTASASNCGFYRDRAVLPQTEKTEA